MGLGTSNGNSAVKKKGVSVLNINVIIGLVLIFGIPFLPAPDPLTRVGLAVLGAFIGTVYLWATVELPWPSIFSIIVISFYTNAIFPPAGPGIWKAIIESVGNWVIPYLLAVLLLTYALTESGFTNRLALWFMTRSFAKKGAWAFTYMFFITVMVFALFIDAISTQLFFFALSYIIFKKIGFEKGDKYPLMIVIGVTFITCLGFAMTPIGHALTIIGIGVFGGASGGLQIGFLQYMMIGIPTGLVAFAIMIAFFRFGVNPDVSKFDNVNFDELLGERPGPMQIREKLTVAVFCTVVIIWIIPGFLDIIAPSWAISKFLHDITTIIPGLAGVIALLVIKVDDKPLLDFEKGFREAMPWGVITLIASAMLFGTVLTQKATGVSALIAAKVTPLMQLDFPVFLLIAVLMLLIIATTNVLNNVPVIILFAALSVPFAATLGVNSQALGALSILAAQWGFALPSALAPIAYLYGNEWAKPTVIMKYGVFMLVVTFACTILIGYPIATAIFK